MIKLYADHGYQQYVKECVKRFREGNGKSNPFCLTKEEQKQIQERPRAFRGTTLKFFNDRTDPQNRTYTGASIDVTSRERMTSISHNPLTALTYAFSNYEKKRAAEDAPVILLIDMQPYKGRTIRGLEADEFVILSPIETKDLRLTNLFEPSYAADLELYLKEAASLGIYPFDSDRARKNSEDITSEVIRGINYNLNLLRANLEPQR